MPLCQACFRRGFCARFIEVGDHQLTDQNFLRSARPDMRAWMLERGGSPCKLPAMVVEEWRDFGGVLRNGAWIPVEDQYERLFENTDEIILFDPERASGQREALVEWLNSEFGDDTRSLRPTLFQRDPSNEKRFAKPGERFRWLASRIRALDWLHRPEVQHWGEEAPQAANDNRPEITKGPFDLDD